jgi:hypothetical protein
MNKPQATGQEQRSKRKAARDLRTANEAKEAQRESASRARSNPRAMPAATVPPYCYHRPGMSAEEATVEAVKAHRITMAIEALGLLWQLRRVALNDRTPPPSFIQKSKEQ